LRDVLKRVSLIIFRLTIGFLGSKMSCLSSGDDGLEDDEDKFRGDEKTMDNDVDGGQWGMLEFLFQAMSGCWGMTKASGNVKEMPKDTKQGRC
jgi:hypothetical protein